MPASSTRLATQTAITRSLDLQGDRELRRSRCLASISRASRRVVVAVLAGLARTSVGHEIGAAAHGRGWHGLCAALRRAGHLCLGTVKEKPAPVENYRESWRGRPPVQSASGLKRTGRSARITRGALRPCDKRPAQVSSTALVRYRRTIIRRRPTMAFATCW